MNAPTKLVLYGLVLVAVFAVAGFTANAVVPEETVRNWSQETTDHGQHGQEGDADTAGHGAHADDAAPLGLGLAQDGYQLTGVSAPEETGSEGELTFAVSTSGGEPVTAFELNHEKEMHLIAVRADGQHFRHVHPELDTDGTWSIPWEWEEAGTYRIFADFVPSESGEDMTLSTTVQVSGDYAAVPAGERVTETNAGGFDVSVRGDLVTGQPSELTVSVARDGEPVTDLEPYLGAFGHLVALRGGDLAYLHVHSHGAEPEAGQTAGPDITFEATAPTEGRYLLYLDFQVDGQVHTAPLVIDATADPAGIPSEDDHSGDGSGNGDDHEDGDGHDH
ncbi:hypothetical protein NE857_25975 [Nocardiopsis exhalans]|uniref:Heavy metal-binding domain-containing protein n=2 Tax=Nocardiopsis TaxID=2013 RepID=A0A840W880_9ACTN|nr:MULTISPECIES: heavy-metal-associated domain-containing protein [Nocardiopsis]MBB5492242.1 hypothetical protein [Nocardiopsis metallicus]USY18707.1 hypothetical protein NE857_25975 [Nocardiopsis exhalans]